MQEKKKLFRKADVEVEFRYWKRFNHLSDWPDLKLGDWMFCYLCRHAVWIQRAKCLCIFQCVKGWWQINSFWKKVHLSSCVKITNTASTEKWNSRNIKMKLCYDSQMFFKNLTKNPSSIEIRVLHVFYKMPNINFLVKKYSI